MVASISAYALNKVDGVYQIGTAQDFKDFATLVNSSEPYACAELTTDIDLGLIDLSEGTDDAMIGKDGQDFQGTFDGKGHAITINYLSGSKNGTALFRNIGTKGLVRNLKVQGTITSTTRFAAGIAAWNSGNIRGCFVDVNIVSSSAGDACHAGIAAVAFRGTVIENCLAKIAITGETTTNCGGVVGWAENRINVANCLVISDGSNFDISNGGSFNISRNGGNLNIVNLEAYNSNPYANRPTGACYNNYVTNQWGDNVATTVVPLADLADGHICYQLNTDQSKINWVQRIGIDPFPIPAAFGTGQVYASALTGCDGKGIGDITYSNSGTILSSPHSYDKYGICTICGCYNFQGFDFDETDRAILLKNADDVFRAEGWNRIGDGFKLNMKMANDIEVISEPGQLIFNASSWIDSDFNGDGHTLTIKMSDMGNNASFLPEFSGTFKNVIMHGSISTNGVYAGSVTSHARNNSVVIKNVYSDINIYTTHTGDIATGGLVGIGETDYRVENSIYAGTIEGVEGTECLAGICGWSSGNCTMVNVAFLGDLINAGGDSKLMSRNPSKVIPTNSYFLNDCGVEEDTRFTQIEEGDIASGKLAFLLNANVQGGDNFYQVIGADPMPLPFAKVGGKVYTDASSYRCDGTPEGDVHYSNTGTTVTIPPHDYVGGFCAVCGHIDETYLTPAADGWYEIGTADQLIWWSHYAAKVNLGANARLMSNIDMSKATTNTPYAAIGNETTPFYGSFDGQFHTISNFKVSYPNQRGVGLIGVMNSRASRGDGLSDTDARNAEGVFIKNVVLDETCEIEGLGYCGIVGMTASWAGHVTFLNVGMDGHVVCTGGANAGGVLGCVMGSTCHITIENCYVAGNCDGPRENGLFSAWLGSYGEIKNCYAIGIVTGSDGEDSHKYFAHYNSATITNCYTLYGGTINDEEHQVYRIEENDISSGRLAFMLNESRQGGENFYQIIGTDSKPLPFAKEGGKVYCQGNSVYSNTPPVDQEGTWTDANGTEWYFTTNEGNATITNRGCNNDYIPSISGTIPAELTIPSTVYIGETPYSVNAIGDCAFYNCSNLTSITIPSGITSIGNSAFYGCSSLISATIPSGVTCIDHYAFLDCSSLNAVFIPKSVTSIGGNPFYGCSGLTSILVQEGNPVYDSRDGCNAIIKTASNILVVGCMNTIIPAGVTSIGYGAFDNCSALTSISIPNSVTTIESYAFNGCSSLTSVTVMASQPLSITESTFSNCANATLYVPVGSKAAYQAAEVWKDFKEIIEYNYVNGSQDPPVSEFNAALAAITDGSYYLTTEVNGTKYYVTQDGYLTNDKGSAYAFAISKIDASAADDRLFDLAFLIEPRNERHFGNTLLIGIDEINNRKADLHFGRYRQDEGNNRNDWERQILYLNDSGKFAIRTSNVAYGETSWHDAGRVFWSWEESEAIIPSYSYEPVYIWSLESPPVTWTDANGTEWYFTTDGSNATISNRGYNNGYIPSISGTIPSDLTIPTTVYVEETPYTVTSIGAYAFQGCSSLTSITIPENVTSIEECAFAGCTSLTSINIPVGVTSIGNEAFFRCSNLASINIPDGITSIGAFSFVGCSSLTSITIPNGVTSVGRGSFYDCSNLTFITLPVGVTSIEQGTFGNCSNLTSINIPDGVTSIGTGSFEGCSSLASITIPEGVTSIGECAFASCYSLTTITIPNGVTSIGTSVFIRSGLTSITIPESVTSIGECAFEECPLNTITVNAVTPPACAEEAFSNAANCTLKVPYGTGDAYATATGWQNFKEIVECDPEGTDISQLANAIYIEPFAVKVGENAQMQICLKNADAATAYVFDLVLPEGITVAKNDKGKYIDELSDRHDDHTRTFNYKGDNAYSLSTLSGNSEQLTGNDGPIRLVTIEASDNMVEGNYAIEIKNASYSKPDGTLVSLPDTRAVVTVEDYVLGDVNGNGGVDIGDAVSIVNYLVGKESSIFVAKAADTNKNGQIDIGDAVTIVNLLVGKITSLTRELNIIWDDKNPE